MAEKRPTLKMIAKSLGLSVPTVSLAISGNSRVGKTTRERVRKRCLEIGYLTKDQLESKQSNNDSKRFGFLTIGEKQISDINSVLLQKLSELGAEKNIRFEFSALSTKPTKSEINKHLDFFCKELDGLMIIDQVDWNIIDAVSALSLPFIILGNVISSTNSVNDYSKITIVGYDYLKAIRMAINELARTGHKYIAFISPEITPGLFFDNWLSGYRLGLFDAGLEYHPELVHEAHQKDQIERVAKRIAELRGNRPTACIIPNATLCSFFLSEMKDHNIEIKQEDVVICSSREEALKLGIKNCILVETASLMTRFAESALFHLDMLVRNLKAPGEVVSIYSQCHNLPAE